MSFLLIETKTRSEGIETPLTTISWGVILIIETKTRSEGIETVVHPTTVRSPRIIETKTRSEGIETGISISIPLTTIFDWNQDPIWGDWDKNE